MKQQVIAFTFLGVFTMFLALPLVLYFSDNQYPISAFWDVNEEENNNGIEKTFEVKVIPLDKFFLSELTFNNKKTQVEYLDKEQQFYIECFSPPPESIL